MSGTYLSTGRPFAGLRPFGFEDCEFFFGREEQVSALYRLLERNRFIAVVGSSGSGKSSLVRAGLLPLIQKESDEPGGRSWRFATLHPGDEPLVALADALETLAEEKDDDSSDRAIRRERIEFALQRSSFGLSKALDYIPSLADKSILLVVDQFEELFRYASSGTNLDEASDSAWRDEAASFVQLLLEVARDHSRSVHVLITMRSDFIGDCAQFYELPEAVSTAQFLVPSLTRDQREDSICKPIEKAGATIDPTLVERLLNDASSDLVELPVLQHCLARLWERAGRTSAGGKRHLTQEHYQEIGTIAGALSQHADDVMKSESLIGLDLAVEQTFRALSEVDNEGRATRRALRYDRLLAETGVPDEQLRRVLDRFREDDCSFIVPSKSIVPVVQNHTRIDVGHEALLRRWERICAVRDESLGGAQTGWLAAETADGSTYRTLLGLLAGTSAGKATLPLDQVEERLKWWTGRPRTEAWAARYGGGYERVGRLFADSSAALEVARARQAEYERSERQAEIDRRLAGRTRRFTTVVTAIAIIAIALGIAAAIAAGIASKSSAAAEKSAHDATALAANLEIRKHLLEAQTKQLTQQTTQLKQQKTLLSHQGQQLLVLKKQAEGSRDQAVTQMHKAVKERGIAEREHGVAERERGVAQSARERIFVELGRQALVDNGNVNDAGLYLGAAYALDSHDPDVRVLLPQALQQLAMRGPPAQRKLRSRVPDKITALQYDPIEGRRWIATAHSDGSVTLWDASDHPLRTFSLFDQDNAITAFTFDPTGRYLAVGAQDGSASIIDLGAPTALQPHSITLGRSDGSKGHEGRINSAVFSRDGTYLVTAGADARVIVWRTASGALARSWNVDANGAAFIGKTPDLVVAALADGTLRQWNWAKDETSTLVDGSSSGTALVRLSVAPDGRYIAAASGDGSVVVYDSVGRAIAPTIRDSRAFVNALSFDASGRHIISARDNGVTRVNGIDGKTVAVLPGRGRAAVLDATSNRAGTTIMTRYADGSLALWTTDGRQIAWFQGFGEYRSGSEPVSERVEAAGFSPDGTVIAIGSNHGRISVLSPGSWLLTRAGSHYDAVESIAFDRSGDLMLTTSRDGTAMLWRTRPALSKLSSLPHAPGRGWVFAGRLSADGSKALTVSGTVAKIWSVRGAKPRLSATIEPTGPAKRFTAAEFVVRDSGILTVQTGRHPLDLQPYDENRWFVWSLAGHKLKTENGWQSRPRQLQVSPNGQYALFLEPTRFSLGLMVLRSAKSGTLWSSVSAAALAHDPEQHGFAVGGTGGTVTISSISGSKSTTSRFPTQGHVTAMAFSDDDRWLAVAGATDKRGKVLDGVTGKLHAVLRGDNGEVRSMAFSPRGGDLVLTTSDDGSARLWSRHTGVLLGVRWLPGARVNSAAFAPQGATVVLGGTDGTVYSWPLRGSAHSPGATASYILSHVDSSNPENACILNQAIQLLHGHGLAAGTKLCE